METAKHNRVELYGFLVYGREPGTFRTSCSVRVYNPHGVEMPTSCSSSQPEVLVEKAFAALGAWTLGYKTLVLTPKGGQVVRGFSDLLSTLIPRE